MGCWPENGMETQRKPELSYIESLPAGIKKGFGDDLILSLYTTFLSDLYPMFILKRFEYDYYKRLFVK